MKVAVVWAVLACGLVASGCARKDFPVSRYEVDQPMQRYTACVYRDAQQKLNMAEAVEQVHLDQPEEIQITKHAMFGATAWEVDATRSPSDGTLITLRHHPGLAGWDKEALASMNACAGSTPLRGS